MNSDQRDPPGPPPGTGRRPLLAAAALAAVHALGCKRQETPPAKPVRPRPADRAEGTPLPDYSLHVAGGRMDPNPPPPGFPYAILVDPQARVELVLRPASPVTKRPYAKIFWVLGDKVLRWDIRWTSEPGHASIRFRGDGQRPFGPGSGELVTIASHVDDIPDDPDAAWFRAPPQHWRVKTYPVRWP